MIRLITFDLDGTMVDTASEIAEAANRTLQDLGLPRRPVADVTCLIGHGTRELMRGLLAQARQAGLGAQVDALDEEAVMQCFEGHYHDTTGTDSQLYPGCLQGLSRLRDAGIQLACVTNKEIRFAERVLAVTGLAPYFRVVIGGDSLVQKNPTPGHRALPGGARCGVIRGRACGRLQHRRGHRPARWCGRLGRALRL